MELKEKLDAGEDFIFIDVREPYEYAEYNLGATLIPMGVIPAKLSDYQDVKEQEIVVHCRSGARSGQVKEFMMQSGFTNVRNLIGGVLEWQARGY